MMTRESYAKLLAMWHQLCKPEPRHAGPILKTGKALDKWREEHPPKEYDENVLKAYFKRPI